MPSKVHIGPYEFVEQIAKSDIAVSYGVHVPTRSGAVRLAALKILNPMISSTPRFQAALAEQTRLAEQLNHPSLAQTFDCGVRDGAAYLLLEYVDGAPLSALLKNQDINASVAAHIVSELAVGVAHAHGRRDKAGKSLDIVHGDIRPRNVLISSAGAVKLVDFGVARARKLCGADPVPEALRDIDLFAYADPEHAAGAEPSIASDVFSLSALLWSMLAGRALFAGSDYASTLRNAQAGQITDIRTLRPEIDPTLAGIVMRGLRQGDEGDRDLATAQSLRTGLSAWLRENDPSFGRHRVAEVFGDALNSAKNLKRSRPLTRREFTPEDAHSVIFTDQKDTSDDGMSVDIRELFSGDVLAAAAAAGAAAPLAAPTRDSFSFEKLDIEEATELAPEEIITDEEILELDGDLEIVSTALPPAGPPSAPSAPPAAPAAPAAPSTPPAPPSTSAPKPFAPSAGSAPTPAAPANASRLSAALAAARRDAPDRAAGTTGSKRGSLPPAAPSGAPSGAPAFPPKPPVMEDDASFASEGTSLFSPDQASTAVDDAPVEPEGTNLFSPKESKKLATEPRTPDDEPIATEGTTLFSPEKRKGSISLGAATRSAEGENIFEQMRSARPVTQAFSPSDYVTPTTIERAATQAPSASAGLPPEEGDLQTEVTAANVSAAYQAAGPSLRTGSEDFGKLADDEFADGPSATRRPAVRGIEPSPSQIRRQAVRTTDFDPNAIYEESSGFYNSERAGSHYDAFDQPPPKKRSPMVPLLILIVVGLAGYIGYNAFVGGEGPVAEATVAGLHVRSTPDRARIFIDDQNTGHTTPHTFADMPVGGTVRVRAVLPGYQDSPSVTAQITAGSLQEVALELQAQLHSIRVSSIPEGATIYVDGNERGVTPTVVGPFEANPSLGVNVSLQLEGHKPRAIQHTWEAGETSSGITLELEELPSRGRRR